MVCGGGSGVCGGGGGVCECGYNFTFLCPSNFLKYSKSIRLHLSLLENIFYGG